jgi:hypothetical protein
MKTGSDFLIGNVDRCHVFKPGQRGADRRGKLVLKIGN